MTPEEAELTGQAIGLMLILNYEATNGKRGGASLNVSEKKMGEWREKVPPLL
jgi:hypothetical protein